MWRLAYVVLFMYPELANFQRVGQQMNVSQDDESTLTSSQTNRSSRGVADGIVEDDDEDTERHQPCSSDFFQTTKIDEFGFIRSPDSK